ncbi:MAG TPA: diguanylate cyclase, partial [Noviherbaspirillum sp.]
MIENELPGISASEVGEELFQRVFRKHSSIMLLIDPENGIIIDANRAAARFYGYTEEALRAMKLSDINVLAKDEIYAEMQLALNERRNYFIFRHRLAGGEERTVEVHSSAIETREGILLFSIVFDVTDRKQAEASLRLASMVYQNSSEAMVVTTTDDVIMAVNPAFTKVTGYAAEEAIGRHANLVRSWRTDLDTRKGIRRTVEETGTWTGEVWVKRKDGEEILCRVTINTVLDDDGKINRLVCQFSDITHEKESDELIWRQANFDALTGLSNRSMFQDRLDQALKKAQRDGTSVALLVLDVDGFKEVNDTLGHGIGDKLLQAAAQRLLHCVRDSDTVARVGGDEFAIIVGDVTDVHNVERVVHAVLQSLAEPFRIDVEEVYVSASMGITFFPDDGVDGAVLLKNADQAMYAAKGKGRNRFRFFTPAMQEAAQARKRIIADLRVALAENQFCLHYQPIVDLRTGAIRKAEALVRWEHPEHGMVSPAAFIRIAEETGMIVELGEWVFRAASRQAAAWRNALHPDFQVSVNVSPVQFQSSGIDHDAWLAHLQHLQIRGGNVVVEITEGLLMDARPEITNQLLRFRDNGMQV